MEDAHTAANRGLVTVESAVINRAPRGVIKNQCPTILSGRIAHEGAMGHLQGSITLIVGTACLRTVVNELAVGYRWRTIGAVYGAPCVSAVVVGKDAVVQCDRQTDRNGALII